MRATKFIATALAILALLYVLSPKGRVLSGEPKNVVEINFMGPGGPIAGAFDDVVRAFERKSREDNARDPSKPVYRIVSGQDAAYDMTGDTTRFLLSVAGGEPPDVVKFDRYAIAEWAARDAFLSLDELVATEQATTHPDAVRRENFYSNVWDEASYKGHIYAVPCDVDCRVLVYNKDMLRRAGLVDAKGEALPPRTWEELREYSKKLNRYEDGLLKTIGFAPNFGNSWLYMFGWMAGARFMSADGTKCLINEAPVVRALTFMRDIYNDAGGYAKVLAFQSGFQGGYLDPLLQGKVAMKIDTSLQMAFYSQYGRDLDLGVAPAPLPADRLAAGVDKVTWSGGFAFAIPRNARNRDAAWDFIRFATSERGFRLNIEGEREIAEATGYPYIPFFVPKPALNEKLMEEYVFANPQVSARVKEGVRVCMSLLPVAHFRPITPVAQLLWTQQVSAMEEALYNRKTPQAALDYAAGVVQRDLDRILAPPTGVPMQWKWFFIGYGVLLVGVIVVVYLWDTNASVRRLIAKMLGRKARIGEGDVIEGARGGYFRQQWRGGILCSMPWIAGFVVFGAGPLLFSVLMSFCDYDVLSPPRFIGLHNYKVLFTEDELAPLSLWNTVYMLVRIPLGMVAGLALAILLNMRLNGMTIFRTLFYLPAIVPAVAGYILWIWIFNPVSGPLNTMLAQVGIPGPLWLQDASTAKPSLVLMSLWSVGGGMIIWLAGLRNINYQLYEAAALDGAGEWKQFLHVTLPQLSPYVFFNLIMGLIGGFKIFDEAFVMTHGGPVNSTLFYVYHLFNNAFRFGHMGYASALAWVLFVIIAVFTFIQMRLANRWVYYESD